MAEAITTSGQLSIRWACNYVNVYLNKILKTENIEYCMYCVDGDTTLKINDKDETIKHLYDRVNTSTLNGVKDLSNRNIFVKSYNTKTGKREDKRVLSAIKRTTVKKMYKVWIDDEKCITVSGDHRFIIKRNDKIIEAVAEELLETDTFINIHGYTKEGTYQCMKNQKKADNIV